MSAGSVRPPKSEWSLLKQQCLRRGPILRYVGAWDTHFLLTPSPAAPARHWSENFCPFPSATAGNENSEAKVFQQVEDHAQNRPAMNLMPFDLFDMRSGSGSGGTTPPGSGGNPGEHLMGHITSRNVAQCTGWTLKVLR